MSLTTKEIIIKNIISLFIGLSCLILGTILYCILIYDNKQDKTKYDKELLTDEIIYLNGSDYENCIVLPCPGNNKVSDECIIKLDIGVRNLSRLKNFEWNDTQNVTYPEDGWGLVTRQISSEQNNKAVKVVDCKISKDKRKLILGGMNPGNAVVYLSHKSCGITETILVTVVDWETWQQRKEREINE